MTGRLKLFVNIWNKNRMYWLFLREICLIWTAMDWADIYYRYSAWILWPVADRSRNGRRFRERNLLRMRPCISPFRPIPYRAESVRRWQKWHRDRGSNLCSWLLCIKPCKLHICRALYCYSVWLGGENEIRTRGTGCPVRRFSKPVVSATHPSLRARFREEGFSRKGVQI